MLILLLLSQLLAAPSVFNLESSTIKFSSTVFEVSSYTEFLTATKEHLKSNAPTQIVSIDSAYPELITPTSDASVQKYFNGTGVMLRGVAMTIMQGSVIILASGNMSVEILYYSVIAGTLSASLQYSGPLHNLFLEANPIKSPNPFKIRKPHEMPIPRLFQILKDLPLHVGLTWGMNQVGHQILGRELLSLSELGMWSFIGLLAETAFIVGLKRTESAALFLRPEMVTKVSEFTPMNRLYFSLLYTFPQLLAILFLEEYPLLVKLSYGAVIGSGIVLHTFPTLPARVLLKLFDATVEKVRAVQRLQNKLTSSCARAFGF